MGCGAGHHTITHRRGPAASIPPHPGVTVLVRVLVLLVVLLLLGLALPPVMCGPQVLGTPLLVGLLPVLT